MTNYKGFIMKTRIQVLSVEHKVAVAKPVMITHLICASVLSMGIDDDGVEKNPGWRVWSCPRIHPKGYAWHV